MARMYGRYSEGNRAANIARPRTAHQAVRRWCHGVDPLQGLLARIVLRIDVVEVPRPVCADLDNRVVFVNEDMVHVPRGQCDEAPRGQGPSLAMIGSFSHAQTERPRDDGDDLPHGMRMWSNAIPLWKLEPKHEQALLAGIAQEHRGLCPSREHVGRRSPFDLLR